ncbi:MAG: Flp family type IVb pilin [Desulfuromonas sp.]|nr:MAG: Flp family type IVb pilin [Desulfuromonas sp.]
MLALRKKIFGIFRDEEGATAVEYGVLIALIIAAVVIIIATLGQQIKGGFDKVSNELTNQGITASSSSSSSSTGG